MLQYLSYDLASRRRLSFFRELLQQEKSGVQLQVVLATNPARCGRCVRVGVLGWAAEGRHGEVVV